VATTIEQLKSCLAGWDGMVDLIYVEGNEAGWRGLLDICCKTTQASLPYSEIVAVIEDEPNDANDPLVGAHNHVREVIRLGMERCWQYYVYASLDSAFARVLENLRQNEHALTAERAVQCRHKMTPSNISENPPENL
jgi:hypothetical protein